MESGPWTGLVRRMPGLVAIPLSEYAAEGHPVLRLHRLCDAVEVLTRFSAIVALAELRRLLGAQPLPAELLARLQPSIERPTFGQWRDMLQTLTEHLGEPSRLILPELIAFVDRHLMPGLRVGIPGLTEEKNLVDLRNRLVHGGAVPRAWAAERLGACGRWLEETASQLSFLAAVAICYSATGAVREVTAGPGPGREVPLPQAVREGITAVQGHVVLIRDDCWLDLWPLCDYGRGSAVSVEGRREAEEETPLIYMRAEQERLLYAALGGSLPHAERTQADRPDAIAEFRRLFQLEDRRAALDPGQAIDFEAEIQADAAALVGREAEIVQAKATVRGAQSGVFWLQGRSGIGKSFLMARLAVDLRGDPKKQCRIAWRFKASDQNRCSRAAFLRHAVARLATWPPLGESEIRPAEEVHELYNQLERLLLETSRLRPSSSRGRPPRVLFLLDGMDEIARLDPDFPRVPLRLAFDNVVWLCAGRPEAKLCDVYAAGHCTHVFPAGLPPMSAEDIRGILVDRTGRLKYRLLSLDQEKETAEAGGQRKTMENRAVDAVVARAEGLPLFVRLVVEDVLSGHFHWDDLPHRLPRGLNAYYDDLLRRLSIGELQAILTPLAATLAWARAPLDEQTLHLVMARRKVALAGEEGLALVRRGLAAVQSMVRMAPIPGSESTGYELYHPTFAEHIRTDGARLVGQQNELARAEFGDLAVAWSAIPLSHPARRYVLRHGVRHLIEDRRWDELERLFCDLAFLEAKVAAGLVFELVGEFAAAVRAMPADRPRRRILGLLEQGIRQEIHFIARHARDYPQALFQCLWNTCWWYDCAEATEHYLAPEGGWSPEEPPWAQPGEKLCELLKQWRSVKEAREGGFVWLRSLRPPAIHLGTALRAVLRGHDHFVESVAFHPDGRRIASASRDRTVRLWDVETGAELRCLRGHEGWVTNLFFRPDGRQIASASADKTIRVWDTETGTPLSCLQAHGQSVEGVAFSPDGRRIASGGADKKVRLWDAETRASLICLQGHEHAVKCVTFSPDGRQVVSGSSDHTLRIWDAETGKEIVRLLGHEAAVNGVAFSPEGRRIASSSWDHTVRLWDAETGAELRCLRGHESRVTGVRFSPDGRWIASGGLDKSLRVFDAETGDESRCLGGHEYAVTGVAFSPDGRQIVSGSWDQTLRLWDAESGEKKRRLRGHEARVTSVVFSPGGPHIASGAGREPVRLWKAETGEELGCLQPHADGVYSLAFSPDNRRIAGGTENKTVRLWETDSGTELRCLRGHEDAVSSVAFSPDNRWVVSGSVDKTIRMWNAQTGDEIRCLRGHEKEVNSVAFGPDSRRIVSGSVDRTVRVWDAESGEEIRCLRGHTGAVDVVAFSPDGRRIVSASFDRTVRIWNAETGECLEVIQGEGDASALAAESVTGGAFRALARKTETVVHPANRKRRCAWFPMALERIVTHPSGRVWAGSAANHFYLIALEGDASRAASGTIPWGQAAPAGNDGSAAR